MRFISPPFIQSTDAASMSPTSLRVMTRSHQLGGPAWKGNWCTQQESTYMIGGACSSKSAVSGHGELIELSARSEWWPQRAASMIGGDPAPPRAPALDLLPTWIQ